MPNRCASNPPIDRFSAESSWNGWGADFGNTRFESAHSAALTADQVPRLRLKWAFGFPNGSSAYGQPAVVAGRILIGSDNGYAYSLNAETGCVYWSYLAKAAVRTALVIGSVTGHGSTRYAAYFGDFRGDVYALDASTGRLLWTKRVTEHELARITGAPTLYHHRLYVPVSATEESFSVRPSYPCCTFRGSVVALDADTGELLWKSHMIRQVPQPVRKNSQGTQLWGHPLGLRYGIRRRSIGNAMPSMWELVTPTRNPLQILPMLS